MAVTNVRGIAVQGDAKKVCCPDGYNYRIGAVTVGASYTFQTKTDFDGQTVLGRIRWDF